MVVQSPIYSQVITTVTAIARPQVQSMLSSVYCKHQSILHCFWDTATYW